jgi:hypothetical protein
LISAETFALFVQKDTHSQGRWHIRPSTALRFAIVSNNKTEMGKPMERYLLKERGTEKGECRQCRIWVKNKPLTPDGALFHHTFHVM